MNDVLKLTESGREIREEGRVEGIELAIRALLRSKYGDIADLDRLAKRLAETDYDANLARIGAGVTLDDLRLSRGPTRAG